MSAPAKLPQPWLDFCRFAHAESDQYGMVKAGAALLKCSRSTLWAWANGRSTPSERDQDLIIMRFLEFGLVPPAFSQQPKKEKS